MKISLKTESVISKLRNFLIENISDKNFYSELELSLLHKVFSAGLDATNLQVVDLGCLRHQTGGRRIQVLVKNSNCAKYPFSINKFLMK